MQGTINRRQAVGAVAGLLACQAAATLPGCSFAGEQDPGAYLKARATSLDLDGSLPADALGDMSSYHVILAGEQHDKRDSLRAKRLLVTGLREQCGVHRLILEVGVGAGIVLDRYLQTGDDAYLQFYLDQIAGTSGCTQDYCEYAQALAAYNIKLDKEDRLHADGVDVDHQPVLWAAGLLLLAEEVGQVDLSSPDDAETEGVVRNLEDIRDGRIVDPTQIKSIYDQIEQLAQEDASCMQGLFGDELLLGRRVIESMGQAFHFYNDLNGDTTTEYRDQVMYENLCALTERYPEERFFGQLGGAHTMCAAFEGQEVEGSSLAMRLGAQGSPVRDAVCSIFYAYAGASSLDEVSQAMIDGELLAPWRGNETAFDLAAKGSPFMASTCLVREPERADAVTTDFFQKLLLLDSALTTPL